MPEPGFIRVNDDRASGLPITITKCSIRVNDGRVSHTSASNPLYSLLYTLSLVLALLIGIGSLSPAIAGIPGQVGPYHVSLSTEPPVIPVGKARLTIKVSDSAGKLVTGAQVRALVKMPSMNMGEKQTTALPLPGQPGAYTTDATFSMAGAYETSLTILGPHGTATGTVDLETGQDTSIPPRGPTLPLLLGGIGLLALGIVLYRMKRTGQQIHWSALTGRGTIGAVVLLVGMAAVSAYGVNHWRRPGAMTPIEAQAMEMNTPAPPGAAVVTLATVTRGSVQSILRYTGQAVGFNEQEVNVRAGGWLNWMPYYVGSRVHAGQLLARLDTSQQDPQVAQQQAGVSMASQGVDVAQRDYQQALASVNQARAEVQGKRDAAAGAQADVQAAHEDQSSALADLDAARSQLTNMTAAVEAATGELTVARSQVTNATAELSTAHADQGYWQQEIAREKSLFQRQLISREEYQREGAQAAAADAKVQQAEAGVQQAQAGVSAAQARVRQAQAAVVQAQAQIHSAEARARKSSAAIDAAVRKAAQMSADVRSSEAALSSAQAAAQASRQRIGQAEAGVEQARAMLAGATTARGYSEVRSLLDGVITQRLISPGTLVNPGQAILRVAQISPIRLQANVPQDDLDRVQVGAQVTVRGADTNSAPVPARVTSITPAVDPVARTGVVEAVVPNQDSRFLPGQYVVMDLSLGASRRVLRVPTAAIHLRPQTSSGPLSSGTSSYVWVADPVAGEPEQYTVRQVAVQTGASDSQNTEITSGLKERQQVVVEGGDTLQDGDTVTTGTPRAPTGGMSAMPGMAGMEDSTSAAPPVPGTSSPTHPHTHTPTHPDASNTARVEVSSQGFTPGTVSLKAGQPARLTFVRKDTQKCAMEVALPDYGIKKALPLGQPVTLEFTPRKGEVTFTCGMGMLKGTVVAK